MKTRRAIVAPTNTDRALWNYIREMFGPDAIATWGYLRSEVAMPAGNINSITFPMTATDGGGVAVRASEKRIKNNDAFLVTHVGVFMGRRVLAQAASSAVLHSFPNPRIFTTELPGIQALYAGEMTIRVNETVYVDGGDVLSFLRADTAQQGNANSSVVTTGVIGWSAWEGDRAFKRLTPNPVFNGLGTNVVSINLHESLALGSAVGADENVATCIFRGFNIQNGASAANANNAR